MSLTDESDEALYAAYKKGDMTAFDTLYSRFQQSLYLFLMRRGLSESQAQDAFHDCWMKVIAKNQQFDGSNFRAWIFRIARNTSIDYFRRAAIRQTQPLVDSNESLPSSLSGETVAQDMDCLQLLKHSIAVLPLDQRDVFLLKQEAGLSLQQIAEMMSVGLETIKSRMRYARQQLKQMLEECL